MNVPPHRQLLIIAPTAPPEVCGVSDFAYQTAQALASFYSTVSVGVARLPTPNEDVPHSIQIEYWQQALARISAEMRTYDVLLNYTPSSYSWVGWPVGLITALCRFKKGAPGNRIFVFVHELWNSSRYLRPHHLIQNQLARWSILQIGQLASSISVVTEGQKRMLEKLLGSVNIRLGPIGANILPADKDAGLTSLRQAGVWVVFGLPHTRLWTLQTFLPLLKALHAKGLLREIQALGPADNSYAWQEAALAASELGPGVLVQKGMLRPVEITTHLLGAEAALVRQDADSLRKSGTFAALAAHAVPVVCEAPLSLLMPPGKGLFRPAEIQNDLHLFYSDEGKHRRQRLHTWFWSTRSWEAIGLDLRTWMQGPPVPVHDGLVA